MSTNKYRAEECVLFFNLVTKSNFMKISLKKTTTTKCFTNENI